MAKQTGPLYFTGTIGDLIFYKVGDHYYVRQKGSYNTRAVQKPGARPLMQLKQGEFGRASKLASDVYWQQLPRQHRGHGVHSELTKIAVRLLRQGKSGAEVSSLVLPLYLQQIAPAAQTNVTVPTLPAQPAQAKPVATPEQKQPACTRLSAWQVSETGALEKEQQTVTTWHPQSNKAGVQSTARRYCTPCLFTEAGFPLKE